MRAPDGNAAVQTLLWTQTMFLASLLAGCEQAMRLPAHLPAAWSLRLAWPGERLPASVPVRVEIPAVGISAPIDPLGLNADGSLEVPGDFARALVTG